MGLAVLLPAGRQCAVCGQGLQGERQVAWARSCRHSEEAGGGGPSAARRASQRDWGSLDSTGATGVNVSGGLRSNGVGGPSRAGRAGLGRVEAAWVEAGCWSQAGPKRGCMATAEAELECSLCSRADRKSVV